MYKHFTKKDWIRDLQLPNNYTVDALIVNGTGKPESARNEFKSVLNKDNRISTLSNLQHPFLRNIIEFQLGKKTIWFSTVYGGAFLSELTHIACMLGSQKNFLVGCCGALQEDLKTGDIVIPTYSYGNESSTRMYQNNKDNKHYSDEKLNKEIEDSIDKRYSIKKDPLVTCQAMLAETKEDIDKWRADGYFGVEMESSTLFAVSNHFKVPSTAIIHISDNLVKNELVGSKEYEENKKIREELKTYKYGVLFENILS